MTDPANEKVEPTVAHEVADEAPDETPVGPGTELEHAVAEALAVLMPIVASMGGNAGTQTLTVAVRALATKELTETTPFESSASP